MNENLQAKGLPLRPAYTFAAEHGLTREATEIQNMQIEWDRKNRSAVKRAYMADLFDRNNLLGQFLEQHWPFGKSAKGERRLARYGSLKAQYEDFLDGREPGETEESEIDSGDADEFAMESDLRNYLASNLSIIESGLQLYEDEKRNGIEFPIDGGFIDILACDKSGRFVVIELKVSRGRSRTIGQLLYYMGWIDKHIAKAPCRGMIVARNITDELVVATSRVTGISLFNYRLSVSLEPVFQATAEGTES